MTRACYVPSCFQPYAHEGPCDPRAIEPPRHPPGTIARSEYWVMVLETAIELMVEEGSSYSDDVVWILWQAVGDCDWRELRAARGPVRHTRGWVEIQNAFYAIHDLGVAEFGRTHTSLDTAQALLDVASYFSEELS